MTEVHITADKPEESSDTLVLRVDQPVSPGSPLYASTVEEAGNNGLARKLLELGCLEAVLLQDHAVTLLKQVGGEPWASVVEKAESAIREHFDQAQSVSDERASDMSPEEKELAYRVQEFLNMEINPMVASHGGFIEVLAVRSSTLFVHMGGGCQGCGMASATLKQGVETSVFREFPELQEVLDTTDHAAGKNPYYAAQ